MKEIKGKTFTEASANITRNLDSSKTYLVQLKNKSTNRSKKYILKGGLGELDIPLPPIISINDMDPYTKMVANQEKKRITNEERKAVLRKEIENATNKSEIKKTDIIRYPKLVNKLVSIKFYIKELGELNNSPNKSNGKQYKLGPYIQLLKNLIKEYSQRSNVDDIFKNLFEQYKKEAEHVIQKAEGVLSSLERY